ncbi:MAG: 2OG-Fe(II) oxygenase [Thiolinea sp.]
MGISLKNNRVRAVYKQDDDSYPVKVESQLNYQSLRDLCDGKILAIRIPGYYEESACQQILSRLETEDELTTKYDNAPELDIYRLGMSFFETRFNKALLEKYFSLSGKFNETVEQICFPHISPLEKLVGDLKKVWPSGADIQRLNQKPMMPGLVRIFLENQVFPPHQDILNRDYPALPVQEHPRSQLAVNIYLRNFDEGGELELWDYAPDDEEVKQLYTGTHDFIDRTRIPAQSVRLRPTTGELIIAQCSKLHAVSPGKGGKRVAFSCFSAYRGENQPLTYWV